MKLSPLMGNNYFMVTNNRGGKVRTEPGEDQKGMTSALYLTPCLWFNESSYKPLFQSVLVWFTGVMLQFQVGSVTEQCWSKHRKMVGAGYSVSLVFIKAHSSLSCLSALLWLSSSLLHKRESWTCNQTHTFLLSFIFPFSPPNCFLSSNNFLPAVATMDSNLWEISLYLGVSTKYVMLISSP